MTPFPDFSIRIIIYMYYLDMHTHRQAVEAEAVAIVCCLVEADGKVDPTTAPYRSYGIHPCRIEGDGEAQWSALLRCVGQPECVAIGEAGLDRLSPIAMSLQTTLFERQAVLAEQWRKPLIVHCVKAWEELLACRKRLRPEQPWVIHGFRAKEPLARQLYARASISRSAAISSPRRLGRHGLIGCCSKPTRRQSASASFMSAWRRRWARIKRLCATK